MSIYWLPDDDEPPRPQPRASRPLARDVVARIYESAVPWDAPTVRAFVGRIWAGARSSFSPLPASRGATGAGFRGGH